jgi:transposase
MSYITDRFWWRTKIKIRWTDNSEIDPEHEMLLWLEKNVGKKGIDWNWELTFDKDTQLQKMLDYISSNEKDKAIILFDEIYAEQLRQILNGSPNSDRSIIVKFRFGKDKIATEFALRYS